MEVSEKLRILSASAKYDVSCVSSGSTRKNTKGGIGNAAESGICHVWGADGRCVSLLKVLFTNDCIYNCAYCVNRVTSDIERATFTVDEICDLTVNFYMRNYIEGLFLSSAVKDGPDQTMELLLKAAKKLRVDKKFNGYIHLKAIPGADPKLISQAGMYADRMSVNIELPTSESLKLLAPQKNKEAILKPMGQIHHEIIESASERKLSKRAPSFVPAGQSTQLIIGATPESDRQIVKLSEALYQKFDMKRVFYSAYMPVGDNPKLPVISKPPLLREHRLYQADWLLRFYGFNAEELFNEKHQNLETDLDPKSGWALHNLHLFPVEINKAKYETILRVPGIGVRSAQKILIARKVHSLTFYDLKKLGVVLKRAKYFITCGGKYHEEAKLDEMVIRKGLILPQIAPPKKDRNAGQLFLFDQPQTPSITTELAVTAITGEL